MKLAAQLRLRQPGGCGWPAASNRMGSLGTRTSGIFASLILTRRRWRRQEDCADRPFLTSLKLEEAVTRLHREGGIDLYMLDLRSGALPSRSYHPYRAFPRGNMGGLLRSGVKTEATCSEEVTARRSAYVNPSCPTGRSECSTSFI